MLMVPVREVGCLAPVRNRREVTPNPHVNVHCHDIVWPIAFTYPWLYPTHVLFPFYQGDGEEHRLKRRKKLTCRLDFDIQGDLQLLESC